MTNTGNNCNISNNGKLFGILAIIANSNTSNNGKYLQYLQSTCNNGKTLAILASIATSIIAIMAHICKNGKNCDTCKILQEQTAAHIK